MMKGRGMKITVSSMLLFAALLLPPLRSSAAADNTKTNVLVYMIGSDLETKDGAASENIEEMLSAAKKFGNGINLIVYAGGAEKWHNDIFSSEENRCVRITKKGAELLYAEYTRDMTDPITLAEFIRYCAENYPADRNVIILWNHGSGYKGFGADELNDYYKLMSPLDLATAFEMGGMEFDIVGFDACMMASVETAYSLYGFCKYMVASEEIEPKSGWHYKAWLPALAKNPSIDSVELCEKITDTYMQWCKDNAPGIKDTLSVVDIRKLGDKVPDALSSFSNEMLDNLSKGEYDIVSVQRALLSQISRANQIDMIDAIELAGSVEDESAKELETVLRDCVVYNRRYPDNINMNGLLIYMPVNKETMLGTSLDDQDTLRDLGVSDSYLDWITSFRKYMAYAQGKQTHERSLMDAINGMVGGEDAALYETIKDNRLDISGCSVSADINGVPQLFMSDEKKRLVMYISQKVHGFKDGKHLDYGVFHFEPEDFPIKNNDFWKCMCDDWLYINDILCPFYMEDKTPLDSQRIAIYGYTRMRRNDDPGALHLRVIYNAEDASVLVEPLCFQRINFEEDDSMLDRVVPVSRFDAEDVVSFSCRGYMKEKGADSVTKISGDLKWGELTRFEWKSTKEVRGLLTTYSAIDLYRNEHLFSK